MANEDDTPVPARVRPQTLPVEPKADDGKTTDPSAAEQPPAPAPAPQADPQGQADRAEALFSNANEDPTKEPEPAAAPAPKTMFVSGRPSTQPDKPKSTQRPYLESPVAFGLTMPSGIARRFLKGRTLLKEGFTQDEIDWLKKDSYVADHGAVVVDVDD